MKGTTELHVTQATIVAAVQLYLDGQFAAGKSPVVMSVKPKNGVGNGEGYVVVVEERKAVELRDYGGGLFTPQTMPMGDGDGWWQDKNGRWHLKDEVVETLRGYNEIPPIGTTQGDSCGEANDKRMVGGERG